MLYNDDYEGKNLHTVYPMWYKSIIVVK